ncbi:cysteine peptidase family C39 domain-containing protein [Microvirga sp. 2TAF3]|uniref:cysteine peptidase family C39 domain-containing protein n=1 Tax=Microvirga sp. 2TAF3 TaxID=3233014 RepID=UPI003F9552C7
MKSRRVPSILQMEAVECGAACLAMVLAHFGRHESLDALRDRCGVSRDGVSATDIIAAARSYHLKARAFTRDVPQLADLPMPQILFWGFNHFVVLERIRGNRFSIVDPSSGRRTVEENEFRRQFTGVTLAFEPEAEFVRKRAPGGVLRQLFAQMRQSGDAVGFVIVASLLLVLLGMLVPGFTRVFIDDYLVRGFGDWLVPLLLGMIAVAALRMALLWLQTRGLLLLQTKITAVMSAGFVWHLFHLPYRFFVHRSPAEVSSRVQLASQIAGTVSGPLTTTVVNLITMTVYAVIMLAYSPLLTVIAVGFAAVNFLVLHRVARVVTERSQRLQMAAGHAHAVAIQGVALIEDHRATGTEALLYERMVEAEVGLLNAEQAVGRVQKLLGTAPLVSSRLLAIAVMGVGAVEVMQTEMTIGMLIAFQMLAEMFSAPLSALVGLGAAIQTSSSAMMRLQDITGHAVDGRSSGPTEPSTRATDRLTGRIETRGLTFGYGRSRPTLHGVDLIIEPRSIVAIAGASGSGKTTLGRLLVGLLNPSAGELLYDGRFAHEVPHATLGASLGYVDQAPYLASGRVRDSLTLWDPAVSDAELERAARSAAAHDVIIARSGGYDGRLGEGGAGLSGGERQRLAIARALMQDPTILVLDEATSALDAATEAIVLGNLRERGITTIIITHRASTLRFCDRAVVLDAGQVSETGSHDELMARNGLYRKLVEAE